MNKIVEPQQTKAIVKSHDFHFNKRWGQNFLIDGKVLTRIIEAANLTGQDLVIEIGPGIGTLTQALAEKAGKVIAIEIDSRLVSILRDTLKMYSDVDIINDDVLKINIHEVLKNYSNPKNVRVVANLPYYITTPVIMKILEEGWPIESLVVMVQKEVADRMVAPPGGKDYGALTLAIQYYTEARLVSTVPPAAFYPPPAVTSAVVLLKMRPQPPVVVTDVGMMFKFIKAAFGQRRKTLLNALGNSMVLNMSKGMIKERICAAGLEPQQRGETLSLEDFARLTNKLLEK